MIDQRMKDLAVWRAMTQKQKACLDSAARAPLYKKHGGSWGHQSSFGVHAAIVVRTLVARGLLGYYSASIVRITRKGSDVFGSVGEKL